MKTFKQAYKGYQQTLASQTRAHTLTGAQNYRVSRKI